MAEQPAPRALPTSPISLLLQNLGMTREDLTRHSDQMRQFLTAENANSLRAFASEQPEGETERTPSMSAAQIRSKSRSLSFTDAPSSSVRTPTPATPIKTEPVEVTTSLRRFDSMEMVIERQNKRSKRDRRNRREREASPALPPSPSLSALRSDPFASSRDLRRVNGSDDSFASSSSQSLDTLPPPITPSARRYYRDTVLYQSVTSKPQSRQTRYSSRAESPSPSQYRRTTVASSSHNVSIEHKSSSPFPPVTPRRNYYKSPLPSSSPAMSTPSSSPARRIVNIVSSPGPMGPEPAEDDYDSLPFTLPPRPLFAAETRSSLRSPHRSSYPFFSPASLDSPRDLRLDNDRLSLFQAQRADLDEFDPPCAQYDDSLSQSTTRPGSGGFRKEHCSDMQDQKPRYTSRKRPAEESTVRKTKRAKKSAQPEPSQAQAPAQPHMGIPLTSLPAMSFPSHLFGPVRPGTFHQPYYPPFGPHMQPPPPHPHTMPAGVIFPALPPGSAYQKVAGSEALAAISDPSSRPSTSSSAPVDVNPFVDFDDIDEPDVPPSPTPLPPSSESSVSLPDLTPNCSSSSPPEPADELPQAPIQELKPLAYNIDDFIVDPEDAPLDALAPGITLLDGVPSMTEPAKPKVKSRKGKKEKEREREPHPKPHLPPNAESPTLSRRNAARTAKLVRLTTPPRTSVPALRPLVTPPQRPSTPPRRLSTGHQLSATRTPLSHCGIHMSPSPSLAYYKSHLNPPPLPAAAPPTYTDGFGTASRPAEDAENLRTPTRRRTSTHITPFNNPVTPRRLTFSGMPESPFGRIFDPHDPSALLDEELARLGAQGSGLQESPAGLFARAAACYMRVPMPRALASGLGCGEP
ncbi:hypothetical protein EVG20_g3898 [Dentipellis fragilis]|uniref:Uncharacterized protein n=1 Tax=Dentipellis fragilis TaxID=205917 RepID=A0A4Y9Z0N8_9AGAM|nr:hypothetical protein EVG20_g3898 [Dentipellis fragilis]